MSCGQLFFQINKFVYFLDIHCECTFYKRCIFKKFFHREEKIIFKKFILDFFTLFVIPHTLKNKIICRIPNTKNTIAINVSIPLNFKLEKLLYNSNIPFLPHICKHLFTNGNVEHTLKKFQIREFFRKNTFPIMKSGKQTNIRMLYHI